MLLSSYSVKYHKSAYRTPTTQFRVEMKVFIADDSQVIRERLSALLSDIEGIEVIGEAKDGLEARDAILEQKPDVVILDLRMPWRNGLDVLRDIKESNPDIKVIILTNYPYPQYRRRCVEEGADYFFDKSSESEKVPEVLAKLISAKKKV